MAMESKDGMLDVHAHEDHSGESEIDLGLGAASGDDRMVSPMAAIDRMCVKSGKRKIKRKMQSQQSGTKVTAQMGYQPSGTKQVDPSSPVRTKIKLK